MACVVNVGDLLAVDALGLIPAHTPDPDAEVRWVATSELSDPTPFLEGREVLLTTGLEAAGWRSEWRAYAERLVAARVVAVGFATGLTHRRLTRALVRACEAVDLNLFEVPRRTTFVAISEATARMIGEGAEAIARRSLEVHRELTQAALRQHEPAHLVGRLADVVDGAAALVDRDGQIQLGPLGRRAAELDPELVVVEVRRIRPQGLRAASSVQAGGATMIVQPVGLTGRPSSYLAVLVPDRASDLPRSASLLRYPC
jgi:purine catabolism regulator